MVLKITTLTAAALVLAACAFGRTYDYKIFRVELPIAKVTSRPLTLAVQDRRPYIVSGGKAESFVGIRRGGFGNPFDMHTTGKVPFAQDFRATLTNPLQEKGYVVTSLTIAPGDSPATVKRKIAATGSDRIALVTLNEWKTDILHNTDLHYDVTLSIYDASGEAIAVKTIKGMDALGPTGEEGLARALGRKLEELFEDERVGGALK